MRFRMWRVLSVLMPLLLLAPPAVAAEKMCIFGIGGQSNTGYGERLGPLVPNVVWSWSSANNWSFANDVSNGSPWPNFGSEFHNLTGLRVMFVRNTVNGGFQTDAGNAIGSGPPSASWDVNGSATPAMIAELQAALTWATGVGFDAKLCGMLWVQGEAEGNAFVQFPSLVTPAIYKAAHRTMRGRFRAAFGTSFPMYIFRTGMLSLPMLVWLQNTQGLAYDNGYSAVRAAQEDLAAEDEFSLMASRMALAGGQRNQLRDPNPPGPGVHWNQDLNDAMGLDGARRVVASGLWNRW